MDHLVFISYNTKDTAIAEAYFTQLELELEKDYGENSPLVQRILQKAEAI